ncbi:hypothetical protein [Sulfurimonas sp.]|uniref:hypothetical protein n=1 Tax=Sulfurimonas sp. TaxID=2022749 RepID=UPI002615C3F5|nr:hypothetical protein [Sulfurimonas sp.]
MNIEKLFHILNRHQELIFYLFEHSDRVVYVNEIEDYCSDTSLDVLENFEIIELSDDTITLDTRVTQFLREYIGNNDTIEISVIGEIIKRIEHSLEIASEYREKQAIELPKIRRELKKINAILFQNLDKLRIRIDRVYKSIDTFELKLKELHFSKTRLDEYEKILYAFESFLKKNSTLMKSFYNHELNLLITFIQENKIALHRSLIPLTQDVIEYINQVQKQNVFVEKILKLKELKDNFELKNKTDIEEKSEMFQIMLSPLRVGSRLDPEVIHTNAFATLLHKISNKASIKSHQADAIEFTPATKEGIFLNVAQIHFAFSSSQSSLIEFLLHYNQLKNKEIDELGEIYCKMILLYEDEYRISSDFFIYKTQKFAKVYYDNRFR